jgi:hypothetical protein
MTAVFLWLNAVLYAVLCAWCTLRWASTSQALGYVQLNGSGRSEYLAVYGGLQLGLAIAFALLALNPQHHRIGVVFGLVLYAAIVPFRWASVSLLGPVERLTLAVGALETGMLLWALALWWSGRTAL